MDEHDEILNIDSWFDDELQSSMIFIFISCIVAIIAFIFLVLLCYKHEKLRKILSFYLTTSNTAVAVADTPPACPESYISLFLYNRFILPFVQHLRYAG